MVAGDEFVRFGIAVVTAGDDDGAIGRQCARPNRPPAAVLADEKRAAAIGQIAFTQRRRMEGAKHRTAVFDESDIDGEFIAAGDEFLGPVERIDQPKPAVADIRHSPSRHAFLGDRRNIGRRVGQPGDDQGVGDFVGFGHRRGIEFSLHGDVAAVETHDLHAGPEGEFVGQLCQGGAFVFGHGDRILGAVASGNRLSTYREFAARPFFPELVSTIIPHCPGFENPQSRIR